MEDITTPPTVRLQRRKRHQRRRQALRRVLLTAIPAAALLLSVASSVAYTYSPTIPEATANRSNIFMNGTLPAALGSWKERGDSSAPQMPMWKPIIGAPVAVQIAGDLAVIDAHAASSALTIKISLSNAGAMAGNYSYLMLPIRVYEHGGNGHWVAARDAEGGALPESYLSLDEGTLSISVPGGQYYAVTVAIGGSVRAFSSLEDASHTLSPRFLVTTEGGR